MTLSMEDFRADIEGIIGSATVMHLFTREMVTDWSANVAPLLHIGVAVMLDKPLIVMVQQGEEIPRKLRRIADHIIHYDPDDMDAAGSEVARVLSEVRDGAN